MTGVFRGTFGNHAGDTTNGHHNQDGNLICSGSHIYLQTLQVPTRMVVLLHKFSICLPLFGLWRVLVVTPLMFLKIFVFNHKAPRSQPSYDVQCASPAAELRVFDYISGSLPIFKTSPNMAIHGNIV